MSIQSDLDTLSKALDLLAEKDALLAAEIRDLEAENERLLSWLDMIDGGDVPCMDARELHAMAGAALRGKRTEDW